MKLTSSRNEMYYKITIEQTGRSALREKPILFGIITKTFKTIKQVKEYIINRYDKMPKGSNKIYHDYEEIGFVHSFWASTIFRGWTYSKVKKWYQSDFIYIEEVHTKSIQLREVKK